MAWPVFLIFLPGVSILCQWMGNHIWTHPDRYRTGAVRVNGAANSTIV